MTRALRRFLTHTVQHAALLANDDGRRTFSAPVARRARIDRGQGYVFDKTGERIPYEAFAVIEGPVEIDPRDAVLLQATPPTSSELNAAPPLIKVDHVDGPDGAVDHVEVYL